MRNVAIVALVVLALLGVIDRVAESYAEGAVADRIDAELDQRPDVEIGGISFLVQALTGHYGKITVSGDRASRAGIAVTDFRADLEGVDLPLKDVLAGDVDEVPTDEIRGSALVRFDDLAAVAAKRVPGITLSAAGKERVRVTGTVTVAGQRLEVSTVSEVAITDKKLTVRAVGYEVAGVEAPAAVAEAIGSRLDITVDLPTLPYRLTIDDLTISKDGVRLAASVRGVVLTG